jgi:hypothetical protein
MEIITRAEALSRSLRRYFTGKPCKHGHACERRLSSGQCTECNRARCAAHYKANPEASRERNRKSRETHKEEKRAYMMAHYPEQFRAAYDPNKRPFPAAYFPGEGWVRVEQATIPAPDIIVTEPPETE